MAFCRRLFAISETTDLAGGVATIMVVSRSSSAGLPPRALSAHCGREGSSSLLAPPGAPRGLLLHGSFGWSSTRERCGTLDVR